MNQINIGVNNIVVRDGSLLLGKRKNCFGAGDWGLVGGHLEFGESFTEGAARELKEETGLIAQESTFSNIVSQSRREGMHYIQIGIITTAEGEPENKEPERCEELRWFPLSALPENIFAPHKAQVQLFLEKHLFSEE